MKYDTRVHIESQFSNMSHDHNGSYQRTKCAVVVWNIAVEAAKNLDILTDRAEADTQAF